jgi:hypothetical protein
MVFVFCQKLRSRGRREGGGGGRRSHNDDDVEW